jgi:hypothetical protein
MQQHTTEIKYDRQSRDYAVLIDREVIGYARNYSEGETLANEYITEQAAQEARAVPPTIDAQLADQGLRRASGDEAGWYVPVEQHGNTVKVWATDEAPAASVPIMHSVTYIHPFSGETETAVVTVFAPIHAEAA